MTNFTGKAARTTGFNWPRPVSQKSPFQNSEKYALVRSQASRAVRSVEGTTLISQVVEMVSSTHTAPSADWAEVLPDAHLEVRHAGARLVTYAIDGIDFLVGS